MKQLRRLVETRVITARGVPADGFVADLSLWGSNTSALLYLLGSGMMV